MRIQVNVNEDLVERIDKYAKTMGTSRSALCAVLIGQGIMGFDKALDFIDKNALSEFNKLLESDDEK